MRTWRDIIAYVRANAPLGGLPNRDYIITLGNQALALMSEAGRMYRKTWSNGVLYIGGDPSQALALQGTYDAWAESFPFEYSSAGISLPPDCIDVESVFWNGQPLKHSDDIKRMDRSDQAGDPTEYCVTGTVLVFNRTPAEMSGITGETTINPAMYKLVVTGVAYLPGFEEGCAGMGTDPGLFIDGVKTTPADDDSVILADSQTSGSLKYLLWSNLKATLKSYFYAAYQVVSNRETGDSLNDDPSKYPSSHTVKAYATPNTRTVAGHELSSDVTISASDVGLGNVTNDAQVKASQIVTSVGSPGLDTNVASEKAVRDLFGTQGTASTWYEGSGAIHHSQQRRLLPEHIDRRCLSSSKQLVGQPNHEPDRPGGRGGRARHSRDSRLLGGNGTNRRNRPARESRACRGNWFDRSARHSRDSRPRRDNRGGRRERQDHLERLRRARNNFRQPKWRFLSGHNQSPNLRPQNRFRLGNRRINNRLAGRDGGDWVHGRSRAARFHWPARVNRAAGGNRGDGSNWATRANWPDRRNGFNRGNRSGGAEL